MTIPYSTWTLVGIGKLGQALLTLFQASNYPIGLYHPDIEKSERCAAAYPLHTSVSKEYLLSSDIVILALPATQIQPFIDELYPLLSPVSSPLFLNMATTISTNALREAYPELAWQGVKFMGQADDLRENGNGLFIADRTPAADSERKNAVIRAFSRIGHVVQDEEQIVESINRLATYYAIKGAKELEKVMQEQDFPELYRRQVLLSLVPGVIRSYTEGTLGHFGQAVADELENKPS